MRVARVLATITLSAKVDELPPGQFLLVQPQSARALRDGDEAPAESIVAYDELAASLGSLVGVSDGREAAMPFAPRPVPFDLYSAAIVDVVHVAELVEE